jgi:hypothetical protein
MDQSGTILFLDETAQFGQCNLLDLAHSFAGDLELPADDIESLRFLTVQPVPQREDFGFARAKVLQLLAYSLPHCLGLE